MTEVRKIKIPANSEVSEGVAAMTGDDLFYLITALGKVIGEEEFNGLSEESCELAHGLAQDIFDRTDGGNEQMCLMAMTICHIMATIYGHIEYMCGMLEIDDIVSKAGVKPPTTDDILNDETHVGPGNDR